MNFCPNTKRENKTHCVNLRSLQVEPETDFDLHLPLTLVTRHHNPPPFPLPPPIQSVRRWAWPSARFASSLTSSPGVARRGNRRDGGLTAAQTPRLTADSITHVTVNGPRWLMISCHVQSRAAEPAAGIKYRHAMDTSTTPMARHSLLEAPHLTPRTRKESEEWDYDPSTSHRALFFPHFERPDLSVASQVARKIRSSPKNRIYIILLSLCLQPPVEFVTEE